MDAKEFRERGKEMIDYIADYYENVETLRVNPDVKPGFLISQLPSTAPEKGETFTQVFEDFKSQVMPGADMADGLYPFFVCATLGTTIVCSFDNLEEIGPICKKENIWLHVDAAFAGSFFVCPEYRTYMKGVEFADSFNFNAHKLLLTNFDCSLLWVQDRNAIMDAFAVGRSYLKDDNTGVVTDFRNWQIPLGRRFRALKLWCVVRCFGIEGIQEHVRNHIRMTKVFQELVAQDDRFGFWPKIPNLGLVCIRLKDSDELTKMLADSINNTGELFVTPAMFKNKQVIRFQGGVGGKEDHVHKDWNTIQRLTDALLTENIREDA